MPNVRHPFHPACAVLLLLGVAGCKTKSSPTLENFTKTINAYYFERSECLFPQPPRFPYETGDPEKTKQLDTLVKAQLLTVAKEMGGLHASRYTPTVTGARVAPRFCYGHRVVSGIDSFTPVAQANGFPETQVTYRYEIKNVPVWARSEDVQAAFPKMAKDVTTVSTAKVTLAGTSAGWQVPD